MACSMVMVGAAPWANARHATSASNEPHAHNLTGITHLLIVLFAMLETHVTARPKRAGQITMLVRESGVAGRSARTEIGTLCVAAGKFVVPGIPGGYRFRCGDRRRRRRRLRSLLGKAEPRETLNPHAPGRSWLVAPEFSEIL